MPTVAAVMIKGPAHGVWGTHLAGTQSGIQVGGSRFVSGSFLLVVCSESAQLMLLGARPCRGAAWPHPVPGLLTAGCFFSPCAFRDTVSPVSSLLTLHLRRTA